MRANGLLFIAALALAGPAAAADGQFDVLGAGTRSCGAWKQSRASHDFAEAAYEGWVQGFISSLSMMQSMLNRPYHLTSRTDAEGLFAWVDNYCSAHPLDAISDATVALSGELLKRRDADQPAGKR